MITLKNISKKIGNRTLFANVNVAFNTGSRYGLTGPNGAGKSTFMKILMGFEEATSGTLKMPLKVGFLRQEIEPFQKFSVLNTVIMGNQRLWNALQEKHDLDQKEINNEIGTRLGEIEEIIAEEKGYSAEAEAEELLAGMGVAQNLHHKVMGQLPNDMQFRVLLCQALFGEPSALLLDEPTNHLDMRSIGWLEHFLLKFPGTLVVISHDRHFLNTITTHIADIDYETLIVYTGNYDQMIVTKTETRARCEEENKSKEKKAAKLQEFVSRFRSGTRASQVQSRIREIDRLQAIDLKKSNIQRPYIRFSLPEKRPGKTMLAIEHISKGYEGHTLFSDFSMEVFQGDKIGVIGNNGLGKTTLLKILAGRLPQDSGRVEKKPQVQIGYFPQNHAELLDKKGEESLFSWLKKQKEGIYDQDVRSVLGKMLFTGDDAFKKISHLSGGEAARLILAGMMLNVYNLFILDEPNNHLDLEAVSALEVALENFEGTVILASHDRNLLNGVATSLIAFEEGKISIFKGSLEEYLAS